MHHAVLLAQEKSVRAIRVTLGTLFAENEAFSTRPGGVNLWRWINAGKSSFRVTGMVIRPFLFGNRSPTPLVKAVALPKFWFVPFGGYQPHRALRVGSVLHHPKFATDVIVAVNASCGHVEEREMGTFQVLLIRQLHKLIALHSKRFAMVIVDFVL